MRTYSARECQNSKRPTDNWCVMVKSELWKVHIAQVVVQLCGACYIVLAKSSLTAGLNQVILSIYQKLTAVICLLIVSAFQHSRCNSSCPVVCHLVSPCFLLQRMWHLSLKSSFQQQNLYMFIDDGSSAEHETSVCACTDCRGPRPRLTGYAVLLMFFAGLNG